MRGVGKHDCTMKQEFPIKQAEARTHKLPIVSGIVLCTDVGSPGDIIRHRPFRCCGRVQTSSFNQKCKPTIRFVLLGHYCNALHTFAALRARTFLNKLSINIPALLWKKNHLSSCAKNLKRHWPRQRTRRCDAECRKTVSAIVERRVVSEMPDLQAP